MPGAVRNRHDFEQMLTGYDAAIAYVDAHVQQVLDELERQNLLDDAVLIVSSDHGDAFGEHGIYSDHVCADECIHRIPLIVRWPGISAENKRSMAWMTNVDLPPTVCDLLGMPAPSEWDGQSYADSVRGQDRVDREFLVWDTGLYTVQRAVRTPSHLYIKTFDPFEYNNMGPVELFDMADDPFQCSNLATECPDIAADCEKLIDTWVAEQQQKSSPIPDPVNAILAERGLVSQ
jgi:arylsulfatase A-like enzyme